MQLAEAAGKIAKEAGALVLEYAKKRDLVISEKGSSFDFVTEADLASQNLVKQRISELFPKDRIIGEEDGLSDREVLSLLQNCGADERIWVVDPLDGTVNYIHGILGYGVSVGVVSAGMPVAGAIYQPEVDVLYLAETGCGAYRNGERLHCSERVRPADALVATGVPVSDMEWRRHSNLWCCAVSMECMNVRMLGSAVYEQSRVAEGGLDFYYELGPHPWDATAAYCLVTEAGGIVSRMDGGAFDYGMGGLLAASSAIYPEAVRILRTADPGLDKLLEKRMKEQTV